MLFFIRNRDNPDDRSLPGVLMLQLRHGHIEIPPQLILQAAQNLPLVLERLRVRDMQLEGEQTDRHERLRGDSLADYFLPAGPLPRPAASPALTLGTRKPSTSDEHT